MKTIKKISCGSRPLDAFLNGGFESGIISTIYGEAATGKSNICMLLTAQAARTKKVIYIDTEGSFSTERMRQITGKDHQHILKNIILLEPTDFKEQKKSLEQIPQIVNMENVAAIIIDSIAMLYRLELGSAEQITETNRALAKQLRMLSEIARKRSIPIIATNQVYADFKKQGDVKMVGGDLLKYWSKCIVKLEKHGQARKATMIKHRSISENRSLVFDITHTGIKEVKKRFSLFN